MEVHGIPREYKGEGRILYIFSTKALIYTAIGVTLGIVFFIFFKMIGLSIVGLIITAFFGLIGFSIATFSQFTFTNSIKLIPLFSIKRTIIGINIAKIIVESAKRKASKIIKIIITIKVILNAERKFHQ